MFSVGLTLELDESLVHLDERVVRRQRPQVVVVRHLGRCCSMPLDGAVGESVELQLSLPDAHLQSGVLLAGLLDGGAGGAGLVLLQAVFL